MYRTFTTPSVPGAPRAVHKAARAALAPLAMLVGSLLVACTYGNSRYLPPIGASQTLYWTFFNSSNTPQLEYATTPLMNSTVAAVISGTVSNNLHCAPDIRFDATGRIWVMTSSSVCNNTPTEALVFNPPLTDTSVPTLTLVLAGTSDADQFIFDKTGNLWVESHRNSAVLEYTGPFTASGTLNPALTLTNGISTPSGLAFDSAGNLYVSNVASTGTNSITVFKAPITNSAAFFLNGLRAPGGLIFDASGNLYASDNPVGNVQAAIVRYNSSNLVSGATPDIIDKAGLTIGRYEAAFAFDSAGNLYDADCGSPAFIFVYPLATAQFSSTLAPSVSYTDSNIQSISCVWDIAIH